MNLIKHVDTPRMMKYIRQRFVDQLKPFEGQTNTETTRLQLKAIIERLMHELRSTGAVAPDIVLQSVNPNPHDATQVEIVFARGDYTETFYQ